MDRIGEAGINNYTINNSVFFACAKNEYSGCAQHSALLIVRLLIVNLQLTACIDSGNGTK